MVAYRPTGTTARGKVSWLFVPTIADISTPTLDELTATGAVDVSCALYEGSGTVSTEANKVQKPRRICDEEQYEQFGDTTRTMTDISYAFNPQGDAADPDNVALAALVQGVTGFLVSRMGLRAKSSEFAVDQWVTCYPVELGPQTENADTSDETAEIQITQPVAITGPNSGRVQVVAGA